MIVAPSSAISQQPMPFSELRHLVPIAAARRAAPLASMVFGGVVKIERAGSGVGAAMKVVKVCLGQEVRYLAGQGGKSQLLPPEPRDRADNLKAILSGPFARFRRRRPAPGSGLAAGRSPH